MQSFTVAHNFIQIFKSENVGNTVLHNYIPLSSFAYLTPDNDNMQLLKCCVLITDFYHKMC